MISPDTSNLCLCGFVYGPDFLEGFDILFNRVLPSATAVRNLFRRAPKTQVWKRFRRNNRLGLRSLATVLPGRSIYCCIYLHHYVQPPTSIVYTTTNCRGRMKFLMNLSAMSSMNLRVDIHLCELQLRNTPTARFYRWINLLH